MASKLHRTAIAMPVSGQEPENTTGSEGSEREVTSTPLQAGSSSHYKNQQLMINTNNNNHLQSGLKLTSFSMDAILAKSSRPTSRSRSRSRSSRSHSRSSGTSAELDVESDEDEQDDDDRVSSGGDGQVHPMTGQHPFDPLARPHALPPGVRAWLPFHPNEILSNYHSWLAATSHSSRIPFPGNCRHFACLCYLCACFSFYSLLAMWS